jgi:hypothetical protein
MKINKVKAKIKIKHINERKIRKWRLSMKMNKYLHRTISFIKS